MVKNIFLHNILVVTRRMYWEGRNVTEITTIEITMFVRNIVDASTKVATEKVEQMESSDVTDLTNCYGPWL